MAWLNEELARHFSEIAELLKLSDADRFRVRAYERAASAIGAARVDLASLDASELESVSGIGASTAKKIVEFRQSGTIGMLEELRAQVPPGLVALTRVPGLGPKTARQLHDSLGLDSIAALREALEENRLRGLPGLGAQTEANLRAALERLGAKDDNRLPAADALGVAEELCTRLSRLDGVLDVAYAGSLRRMRETVGDIDVLVSTRRPDAVMSAFRDDPLVSEVLADGERKMSILSARGLQADLRAVEPDQWGAALIYFTGSKAHNVRIRERAVRADLLVNEYGVFERSEEGEGARVAGRTEQEVYDALGLSFVPAPMREDAGEVEAAAAGRLPAVVTLADLRGDLHGHSDWSGDGKASLEEMVHAAAARGWEYWGVTDHAEGLPMNGLSRERMLARREAIARLQAQVGIRILDGVELNIGVDGSVDYDTEFLLDFDLCVASVHTAMQRSGPEQTARIIRAMEHPAVHVIGHLTGRQIGRRPPFDVDLDAVLDAALRTGTALEVNASPRRLDLSGEMVRRAVDAGVTLTISSDAHAVGDLTRMGCGVATAQRGWATADDVLNCRDLDGLLAFTRRKREWARRS